MNVFNCNSWLYSIATVGEICCNNQRGLLQHLFNIVLEIEVYFENGYVNITLHHLKQVKSKKETTQR